jgi:hypothetical protein
MLAAFNAKFIHEPKMNVVITVGNISKMLAPFILGRVRAQDPYIKKNLKRFFAKITNSKNSQQLE